MNVLSATATEPAGGLSVIIPTLNEEGGLAAVLDHLGRERPFQVIVVDGESEDATVRIAEHHGAEVVRSARCRGAQMNAGAQAAKGKLLIFLHADTLVPSGFEQQVREILSEKEVSAGAFRLAIDGNGVLYRILSGLVNWRARWFQAPFGDQAIFTTAESFREVGGYREIPAMEDHDLIRRLRGRGRIAQAPACVVTSARRWQRRGVLNATLLNLGCLLAYHLGVSPERIAGWRERRRER